MKYIYCFIFLFNITAMEDYNSNMNKENTILNLYQYRVDDNNVIVNDNLKGGNNYLSINNSDNNNIDNNIDNNIVVNDNIKDKSRCSTRCYKHCCKYKLFYILGSLSLINLGISSFFLINYLIYKSNKNKNIITPTTIPIIPSTIPGIIPTAIISTVKNIIPTSIAEIIPTAIINTVPKIIPTTIPDLNCVDLSDLCNYKNELNFFKSKISSYSNITEGEDYCFGNIKNKTNKIGFYFNNDTNCVLYTNKYIRGTIVRTNLFYGYNFSTITFLHNNMSELISLFDSSTINILDITNLSFDYVTDISTIFRNSRINCLIDNNNKEFKEIVNLEQAFEDSNINNNILNLSNWKLISNNMCNAFKINGPKIIDISNIYTTEDIEFCNAFYSNTFEYIYALNLNTTEKIGDFDNFINSLVLKEIYLNKTNNPNLTDYLEDEYGFTCNETSCVKRDQKNNLFLKKENSNSTKSHNTYHYLFEISNKVYNITSYIIKDYMINHFKRLLRVLR